jgi:hypothetical protein
MMPMLTFSARLGSSSGRTICLHHIVKSCPRSHARGLLGVPTTTRKTPSLGSWPLRLLGSYDLQYYAGSRQANQGIKARTTHTGIISLAASDVRLSSTCKLPATSTLAASDDDCFYTIVDCKHSNDLVQFDPRLLDRAGTCRSCTALSTTTKLMLGGWMHGAMDLLAFL